jgi:hypothetical protein
VRFARNFVFMHHHHHYQHHHHHHHHVNFRLFVAAKLSLIPFPRMLRSIFCHRQHKFTPINSLQFRANTFRPLVLAAFRPFTLKQRVEEYKLYIYIYILKYKNMYLQFHPYSKKFKSHSIFH